MKQNKFFYKFLEHLDKLDDNEIKQFVEFIEQERVTFQSILNELDEALISYDENRIIFLNSRAKQILKLRDFPENTRFEQLSKYSSNPEILDFISHCDWKRKSSQFFSQTTPVSRYYSITHIGTDLDFCIIKISDMTTQKELESQLNYFESLSALNTLAAGIAHEIRNPLAAIDLHTQLLKRGINKEIISVSDEIINYIRIVEDETHRLNNILNDFLLSARKRKLKLSFVNISDFLDSIITLMQPVFDENKIIIEKDVSEVPDIFIDPDYLKQAIINLLKNATEAMEKSNLKKITIRSYFEMPKDSVAIEISDTGEGIEKDKIKKIFEPYYSSKNTGTGLGLTIVYKIVHEHGGDIKIDSKPGQGTTFTIYLPIRRGQKLLEFNEKNT